jgi:hypothetical protein
MGILGVECGWFLGWVGGWVAGGARFRPRTFLLLFRGVGKDSIVLGSGLLAGGILLNLSKLFWKGILESAIAKRLRNEKHGPKKHGSSAGASGRDEAEETRTSGAPVQSIHRL